MNLYELEEAFLLRPKLLYLLLNMSVYSCYHFGIPYLNVVWKVPFDFLSFLNILTAFSFLGSVLWTSLTDRSGLHRLYLILLALLFCSSFSLLQVPAIKSFFLSEAADAKYPRLAFVSGCFVGASFFISGLYPLLDNRVFQILTENGANNKELYGRQRLWGAVGQAIMGPIIGKLMERWGWPAMFFCLWACTLLFVLAVFLFVPQNTRTQRQQEEKKTGARKPSIVRTLFDLEFLLFLLMVALGGFSRSVVGNFLTLYLKDYFNMASGNQGWVLFIRVAPEILCFFSSKFIIRHLGLVPTLLLSMLTGTIRVGVYAFLPVRPELGPVALGVELLKGVNNALLITAGAQLAHELVPKDSAALAQGLFMGVHGNLATALAGIAGLIILRVERDSPYPLITLFRFTFAVSMFGLLLAVFNQLWVKFRNKQICNK